MHNSRTLSVGLILMSFFFVIGLNAFAQDTSQLNEKNVLKNADDFVKQHKFTAAKEYLLRVEHRSKTWSTLGQANYHLIKGVIHFELYQFSEALLAFEQAKGIIEASPEAASLRGLVLLNIGKTHKEGFYNPDLAREFYKLALTFFQENKDEANAAATHFQFARSYSFAEIDKREYHNLQALAYYEQHSKRYKKELAECYNLEGIRLSYAEGIGESAFAMYNKAITTASNTLSTAFTLGKYYDNLGFTYSAVDPRKGLTYLKKGLQINLSIPDNDYWIASSYNNMAAVYTTHLNNKDSAIFFLKKVLPLMRHLYADDHPEVSNAYQHLAYAYKAINSDSALMYFRKALLISSSNDSVGVTLEKSMKRALINNTAVYAYGVVYQSEMLWSQYKRTKDLKYIQTALHNFNILHQIIIEKLMTVDWENSRANNLKELRVYYNRYLELLHEAYALEKKELYAAKALDVMEAIRYVSVLENKREATAFKVNQADGSSSNKLLSARANYAYNKTLMDELRKLGKRAEGTSTQNNYLAASQQYFALLDSRDTLLSKNVYVPVSSQLNQLPADELMIEYYESDDCYYALAISPAGIQFDKIENAGNIKKLIYQYEQHFTRAPQPQVYSDSLQKFVKLSHQLYLHLLKPFEPSLAKAAKLTVIPDGSLYRFPFETLLRSIQKPSSFKELDYLMKSMVIKRALSINQLLDQEMTTEAQLKIAAFASALLPAAEEEVKSIAQFFNTTTAINTQCTVSTFNQVLPLHNLLHLAVHGESNLDSPMRSHLVFNQQTGDTLYAYQLYSYDLSDKVFVLSACKSGVGLLKEGEGVFSISRAFFYAGAEAVILTLWNVADQQTSVLMREFYKNLTDSESPEKALQVAKLNYLSTTDAYTAHPIYWAGIIVEGSALKHPKRNWIYYGLSCLLMLVVFGIMKYRKRY